MTDLRLAVRSLAKTPLVATVATLSLALGLGANAAIFSIFEKLILRPLPVSEPDRLVNLLAPGPKPGSQSSNNAGDIDAIFSYPMFRDLEARQEPFAGIAAHRLFWANLAYDGSTANGEGMLVSGRYFEVLGLRPAHGRLFGPDDDRTPGAHPLVVLSHAYWTSRFNAGSEVLGRALVVNGHPMTIIGVAPRGFQGTTVGTRPKIFVPLSMRGQASPGWDGFENRRSYWVYLFARLRPGVSLTQAAAAINVPYRAIVQEVEAPLQSGLSERTLEEFRQKAVVLEEGRRGQSTLKGRAQTPLLLLLAVSGTVLLIAGANVANLLLARATDRGDEIALRLAIGAQRRQLVAQLLSESLLLALAGGGLGLFVAHWTLRLFAAIAPVDSFGLELAVEPATWLFLGGLSLATSLVGLFPAWHSTRQDLVVSLRSQSGGGSGSRAAGTFRSAMTTMQVALSMALLISAGLFTRSLFNAGRVDLGFDVERLATFGISPRLNGYTPTEARALFDRAEQELAALPGVTGVTASLVPLISGSNWGSNVSVQGFPATPDTDTHSNYNEIGPGYFRTLGVPLLAGRGFEARDDLGAPKVAIVNEAFARKFNLGRDAVGRRMQVGSGGELDIEIVGLVQDAKYSEVKDAVPPLFYLPYRQQEDLGSMHFYVRSSADPGRHMTAIRRAMMQLDTNLPVEDLQTMELQVASNLVLERMLSTLSAAFAGLATLLAAVGLYGVVAYAVAKRTREIGLRMALGADAAKVRRLVLGQVHRMTVPGAALGILAALALGRAAESQLYELEGHDPVVFIAAALFLMAVATGAGFLPARRAARVDPMVALREE